jgi:ribosome biogenesis protein NSA1
MRVVTADETGLIKVIAVETREVLAVSGLEQQSRERCVKALSWGNSSNSGAADYSCLHVGREDGVVESWSLKHTASRGSKVRGTAALSTSAAAARPGFPEGLMSLAAVSGLSSDNSAAAAAVVGVSATGDVHISSSSSSGSDQGTTFNTGGPVDATSWRGTTLATGGKERDVQLWDLHTQQCTWRAKNVPMDYKLQLRIPVWVTAVAPLHSAQEDPLQQQLIAGTAYKHLRFYDARAHRRPVKSLDYGEYRITALVVAGGGREAIIADAAGEVTCLDLRTLRRRRRYSGGGGSTRCLALHPTLPVFAAVGLDRMCRVYDINSSSSSSSKSGHTEPLHSIYLKQRANRVLFCEEGRVTSASKSDAPGGADVSSDAEDEEAGWGSGEEYDMSTAGAASGSDDDDSGADSGANSANDDNSADGDSEAEDDDTAASATAAAAAEDSDDDNGSGSDSDDSDNSGSDSNAAAAAADHDDGSGSDSSEEEEEEQDAAAAVAQRRARAAAAAAAQSSSSSRQRRQQSGDAPAAKAPASKRFKRTR